MSEIMRGVLNMPPELWTGDPLDVMQRHAIYKEAWRHIAELDQQLHASVCKFDPTPSEDYATLRRQFGSMVTIVRSKEQQLAHLDKGMTHPNERDCEHGQHRKSCNICEYERDIAERDQRIAQLEQQADVDRSFIEQYQRQVAELEQQLAMAHRMIECREANELNLEKQLVDARRDAERYKFLRARDLDTIDIGGIFVGVVPDNLVINENDLDAAVDAAIAERQESGHG